LGSCLIVAEQRLRGDHAWQVVERFMGQPASPYLEVAGTMSEELARYLEEIAGQLTVDPSSEREILAEIQCHLQEAVAELEQQGHARQQSVALALERFGESREEVTMLNRLHSDSPWVRVGVAILPGLFALADSGGVFRALFGPSIGETLGRCGLIGVCILVIAAGFARERRLAVWSYPALGVLLFGVWGCIPSELADQASPFWQVAPPLAMLAVLAVIATLAGYSVRKWPGIGIPPVARVLLGLMILSVVASFVTSVVADRNPDRGSAILAVLPVYLWWMVLLLSPVAIGLPLALRNGLLAGLMVVAAEYVLVEGLLDPAYGVLIWTSNSTAATALACLPALAFLIVPPIWILGCRGAQAKWWGLVLPALIGLVSSSAIRGAVLHGTAIEYGAGSWLTDCLTGAQLLILLTLTGVIYHWIGPRGAVEAESFDHRTSGSMSLGCAANERRA